MSKTMTADQYIKRYYPLVTARIVSLRWMANRLGVTPSALRSRAYRLGVTGNRVPVFNLLRDIASGKDRYYRMHLEAR